MQAGSWGGTRDMHEAQGDGSESKADSGGVPLDPSQLGPVRFSQTFHPCLLTCVCRSPAASSRARAGSPMLAGCSAGPGWGTKRDVATTIT